MHRNRANVRWIAVVVLGLPLGCMRATQQAAPGALPRAPMNHGPVQIRPTTYFAHGHLLEREGRFDEAIEQYRKALRLKPDFVAARNRLGITLNKLGRHREATNEFLRAVELRPEEAYLHNNLGFSLYLEGNYTEALAELEKALQLTPDFARARMNYALVLAKLGRYDDAFEQLSQVGEEADACFNMGMLLSDAGRYADAARYLQRAIEVRPTFAAARIQLREVARIVAEQEARTVAANARRTEPSAPPQAAQARTLAAQTATPTPPASQPATGDKDATAGASAAEPASHAPGADPQPASQPERRTVVAGVSFERPAATAGASPAVTAPQTGADSAPDPNEACDPPGRSDDPRDEELLLWELSLEPSMIGELLDELLSFADLDDPEAQDILCTLGYLLFPETAPQDFLRLPPP